MAYAMMPLAVLLILWGVIANYVQIGTAALEPPPPGRDETTGAVFLAYRQAISNYVAANPTVTGSIPLQALTLPPGMPVLPDQGNSISSAGQGQSNVLVWAAIPAAGLMQAFRLTGGDATLGLSTGSSWTSPTYGAMGPLPSPVTPGDAVSFLITNPEQH